MLLYEFNARIMRRYIRQQESRLRSAGIDFDRVLREVRETPFSTDILGRFCRLTGQQDC